MRILLISENVTIQKLFKLSADKSGDSIEIGSVESIPDGDFDVIFIDKEILNDEFLESLKAAFENAKFILILGKEDEKEVGFDEYLIKPFLPTDLISLLDKFKSKDSEEFNIDEFSDNIDIDNLEDFDLEDEEDDFDLGDINDVFVDNEELNTESLDEDIENDIEVNPDELISEDSMEEKALEEELANKEDIDGDIEAIELDEFSDNFDNDLNLEETADDESSEENDFEENEDELSEISDENFSEEENKEENIEIKEDDIDSLNEKELAQALGEEVSDIEEIKNTNVKENTEDDIVGESIEEKNNAKEEPTIEEKTLGNILNINWEELKKAKAKVTITIDFGG